MAHSGIHQLCLMGKSARLSGVRIFERGFYQWCAHLAACDNEHARAPKNIHPILFKVIPNVP